MLKTDSDLLKKKYFICFNESPLKMMKNVFYFTFYLTYLTLDFCPETVWLEK